MSGMCGDISAAIERDDEEIAELEKKLGFSSSKQKAKLYKEYETQEGYGEGFGDFLEGLDAIADGSGGAFLGSDEEQSEGSNESSNDKERDGDDESVEMKAPSKEKTKTLEIDQEALNAMERDDVEIAELEKKLGFSSSKQKKKLYKEYETQEGYGEGFGDFLDSLDAIADVSGAAFAGSDDEMSDEDSDSNRSESEDNVDDNEKSATDDDGESSKEGSDEDSESQKDPDDPDHDAQDTYRPSKGEDIYGKKQDSSQNAGKPSKYVPPHLRKQKEGADDKDQQEKKRVIRQLLNSSMNRLSEDTLISVAQSLTKIYKQHPTGLVHDMIWDNTQRSCINSSMLMSGLVPVYVACIVGVHLQTDDTIQLGESILEKATVDFFSEMDKLRSRGSSNGDSRDQSAKSAANFILVLCYLYNFNVAHCSLMYDIIRNLIDSFREVDIECLLLLLSHSGKSLRADDPMALKDIVVLVQKKSTESDSSVRAEYMVTAIMDLKNNKRRNQDAVLADKVTKLRKLLGRIRSSSTEAKPATALRISLQDLLDAETKGRWWKVGASWVGNQYKLQKGEADADMEDAVDQQAEVPSTSGKDKRLLRLASKYRMNTDRKRSIFCIIMDGTDYEDVFEKLCRGGMLQNRTERDTIRVLLECCMGEKSYNKFYSHLAARLLEYQPQCKFSLQLAFWDAFKNFGSMKTRKAANLAKFLFDLIVFHDALKAISVLKGIDLSEEKVDQSALVFLTVLFSCILEHYDDPKGVKKLLAPRPNESDEEEGFRASLLAFFLETLRMSPNNKKGSKFRKNFKAAVKGLDTDGFGIVA